MEAQIIGAVEQMEAGWSARAGNWPGIWRIEAHDLRLEAKHGGIDLSAGEKEKQLLEENGLRKNWSPT